MSISSVSYNNLTYLKSIRISSEKEIIEYQLAIIFFLYNQICLTIQAEVLCEVIEISSASEIVYQS